MTIIHVYEVKATLEVEFVRRVTAATPEEALHLAIQTPIPMIMGDPDATRTLSAHIEDCELIEEWSWDGGKTPNA